MYATPELVALAADVDDDARDDDVVFVAFIVAPSAHVDGDGVVVVVVVVVDVDVDVAITQYISCKITFIGIRSLLP